MLLKKLHQKQLLTIEETAEFLGVSKLSLRLWDREGKLKAKRTIGGHRRYELTEIEKLRGVKQEVPKDLPVAIYSRVSSYDQKKTGDLERQKLRLLEYAINKGYNVQFILDEIGSGLSSNRKQLKNLLKLAHNKEISKIIIEHRDRLSRFMYESFKDFFKLCSVQIECIDDLTQKSYEIELAEDIILTLASFSGKIHGKRSNKHVNSSSL